MATKPINEGITRATIKSDVFTTTAGVIKPSSNGMAMDGALKKQLQPTRPAPPPAPIKKRTP